MTVTLKQLRDSAQMDDSAFQSALDARASMTPSPRRADETMEAYVIRLIREEERERCAKIAEAAGASIHVHGAAWIAAAIRKGE